MPHDAGVAGRPGDSPDRGVLRPMSQTGDAREVALREVRTPRSRSHETGLTKRASRSARPAILILLLPLAILAVLVRLLPP